MNSFNHYSLGSVGQWLYQDVAGIDTDPDQPGYQHILLHPHPAPSLTEVHASYNSIRGPISSAWKTAGGQFTWDVTIPANTTATAFVPTSNSEAVQEGGLKISAVQGITPVRLEAGTSVYELGSGTYHFSSPTGNSFAER